MECLNVTYTYVPKALLDEECEVNAGQIRGLITTIPSNDPSPRAAAVPPTCRPPPDQGPSAGSRRLDWREHPFLICFACPVLAALDATLVRRERGMMVLYPTNA